MTNPLIEYAPHALLKHRPIWMLLKELQLLVPGANVQAYKNHSYFAADVWYWEIVVEVNRVTSNGHSYTHVYSLTITPWELVPTSRCDTLAELICYYGEMAHEILSAMTDV